MIMRWNVPGRKIAIGKHEYKTIIEKTLVSKASLFAYVCQLWLPILLPFLFDDIVRELMWGLKNLMHFLVPQEKK